ncbi:MAG: HlyD family efflux transporter periplasmic adaptor subunit, partial [Lachnospiraceae bacterium]|nr:HlyD family efflux transporter periplasmic adaptor subunit [Lachnospiraceae bacterium]
INKEKLLANTQAELLTAEKIKEQAQKELEQLLKDIDSELKLGSQSDAIREQREKIAKLKENAVGAVIKAPMAGTVTGVNKIAGESISPNEELAVMQPEGKGFQMSFSVTPEQAKKVTVGEQAEIQNSWYYNDIVATLSAIRPDPESNGSKKLLVFNVTGDVQVGQSISVSVGQKSASYDLVVPNSAVREDNNGKFILIVEAKNSPLGNRYMATRVDVEVLGADDNKTAIKAPLYGYEFVITTATQPVEAGKQVRLAEN